MQYDKSLVLMSEDSSKSLNLSSKSESALALYQASLLMVSHSYNDIRISTYSKLDPSGSDIAKIDIAEVT